MTLFFSWTKSKIIKLSIARQLNVDLFIDLFVMKIRVMQTPLLAPQIIWQVVAACCKILIIIDVFRSSRHQRFYEVNRTHILSTIGLLVASCLSSLLVSHLSVVVHLMRRGLTLRTGLKCCEGPNTTSQKTSSLISQMLLGTL